MLCCDVLSRCPSLPPPSLSSRCVSARVHPSSRPPVYTCAASLGTSSSSSQLFFFGPGPGVNFPLQCQPASLGPSTNLPFCLAFAPPSPFSRAQPPLPSLLLLLQNFGPPFDRREPLLLPLFPTFVNPFCSANSSRELSIPSTFSLGCRRLFFFLCLAI